MVLHRPPPNDLSPDHRILKIRPPEGESREYNSIKEAGEICRQFLGRDYVAKRIKK